MAVPSRARGEITLAHLGVLFLDELTEFPRAVLDVLREPLESGHINVARAARQVRFPARFQLVAAMNPCPCGYLGDPKGQCRCTPDQVARYQGRLSGPLLDRIDLDLNVPRVEQGALLAPGSGGGESSAEVRARVIQAHQRQLTRQGCSNAVLDAGALDQVAPLDRTGQALMAQAMDRLGLSARGLHRVIKLARTIADLADVPQVGAPHLAEALQYRALTSPGTA